MEIIRSWFKSSESNPSGNCFEAEFVRSSRCEADACVEVAKPETEVLVRHSKHPEGPVLRFSAPEWEAFLGGVRLGEFDLPS